LGGGFRPQERNPTENVKNEIKQQGYNPSYPFIRPFIMVMTPFITSRGPPRRFCANQNLNQRHSLARLSTTKTPKDVQSSVAGSINIYI